MHGFSVRIRAKKQAGNRRLLPAVMESLESRRMLSANVTSYHQDAASTGQDSTETLLTPANVNSTDFGRIFDTTLDGQVYAQPLAVADVDITRGPNQGVHDVIYVATMHDSLFAIDSTTGQILWQDSFLQISNPEVATILSPSPTPGVTTVPAVTGDNALVDPTDVGPELGILATPVIDSATNVLYVVANTQEIRSGLTPVSAYAPGDDIHYVQRIWAVNLSDGSIAIAPANPPIEPASGGEVIGDTILDPTPGNTVPDFTSYTGYEYVAGPYVPGSGNNGGSNADEDGWAVNPADSSSPWGALGETAPADGYIAFNALVQMGRTALSLIDGTIYFGYASHGDDGPYYGWLLGYSATTLANTAAFMTAPTYESFATTGGDDTAANAQAGLWGSGMAITTDGTYLYIDTGNGAFNPDPSNFSPSYVAMDGNTTVELPLDNDYGNAVIKLAIDPGANPNGYGLKVVDFFVPSNEYEMNNLDEDLGSGGVLMIPASGPGYSNPDGDPMLVVAGKEGRIYLLDADNLGGFNTAYITDGYEQTNQDPSAFDRVLGEYYYYEALNPGTDANNRMYKAFDTASYFNGNIYISLSKYLPEWEIGVASLLAGTSPPGSGVAATISFATTSTFGVRGTTSTISSDGGNDAIVWSVNVALAATDDLLAFDASNLSTLYDSQTDPSRDSLTNDGTIPGTSELGATGVKFAVPTVFNGTVYVGTGGGSGETGLAVGTLVGYGLLPTYAATASNFGAPGNLKAQATSSGSIALSWTNNSPDATEFEIKRSVNGGGFSVLAYVAQDGAPGNYTDTSVSAGNSYQYKVRAVSGGTMSIPATGGMTAPMLSASSGIASVASIVASAPTLVSAESMKTEGAAGTFGINLPLSGTPGVESRYGGPTLIVLTFSRPVVLGPNFDLSLSSGRGTAVASGSTITLTLSGAVNGQTLNIFLDDVQDAASGAAGNYSLSVGVLLGDLNGDGVVNSSDLNKLLRRVGQVPNASDFREDITGNGIIDSNDVTDERVNLGQTLSGAIASPADQGESAFDLDYLNLYRVLLAVAPVTAPSVMPAVRAAPAIVAVNPLPAARATLSLAPINDADSLLLSPSGE